MKKQTKTLILLSCLSFIVILLIFYGIFSGQNSEDSTTNQNTKFYKDNVDALSSVVDKEIAQKIVVAFEEINLVNDNTIISKDDVYKINDIEFEVYFPLMVHCKVENETFIISTYETTYSEETAIVLYNSTTPDTKKILTEEERSNLLYTQRQTVVHNTISITPRFGFLLQNALGTSKFSLEFTNLSETSIGYVMIVVTPCILGTEFDYKNAGYTLWDTLEAGQSVTETLTISTWSNYDTYRITKVTVMFNDGTSILLDKYDCQFLDDVD